MGNYMNKEKHKAHLILLHFALQFSKISIKLHKYKGALALKEFPQSFLHCFLQNYNYIYIKTFKEDWMLYKK